MCYDISFSADIQSIQSILPGIQIQPEFQFDKTYHQLGMSFNKWPVVVNDSGLKLKEFTWGPVPKRLHKPEDIAKQRQFYLNARSEKFLQKGTDWYAIRGNRVLIPVTGFFEYREVPGMKIKVPYYIHQGGGVFFIAGLWTISNAPVRGEDGKWQYDLVEPTETFTLATREANPLLKQIHNSGEFSGRMPLIFNRNLAPGWLDPDLSDFQIQEYLNYQEPAESFQYWPVNSVRKKHDNDESVIARVDEKGIPPITV